VVKNFGKYYDPVYKIELFNEALSMKPKQQNSKVYNIFKGKIVYAKKNSGSLENVVIVQHKNGLHTIYSHLDKIAPTLKTGKWIKKGFVVGRVSDTLMFQSTKNSKYINPLRLIKKVRKKR
jgi:murein DD-endopeptidase MepM/ murein hydrolase activator NlpD